MLSFLFAFLVYALVLLLLTILIYIYINSKKNQINKKTNEMMIFSYLKCCDAFYQQLNSKESCLNPYEKKVIKLLFNDVRQLSKIVNYDNIGSFLNQIIIQEEKNNSLELDCKKIDNIDLIMGFARKKAQLVLMIICHNLNLYNAERILHDPEREANEVLKKLRNPIQIENKIPNSQKRNNKSYYEDIIKKDITNDFNCKNPISKSTILAVA